MNEWIDARVLRVMFNRESFYVLNVAPSASSLVGLAKAVAVRGNLYGLQQVKVGTSIRLLGSWSRHRKYGMQFACQSWAPFAPANVDIEEFLHISVEGFENRDLVNAIVSRWGLDTFQALTERPSEVLAARPPTMSEDAFQRAVLCWEQTLATRDLSTMLRAGGLGATEAQLAISRYGNSAPSVILGNAYRLMEIPGFSFPKVDRLGAHLGVRTDDPRRLEGAILWCMQEVSREGHLFMGRGDIPAALEELVRGAQVLPVPVHTEAFPKALHTLIDRGALILDPLCGVYLPELYRYERDSGKMVSSLLSPSTIKLDLQPFLADYEKSNAIQLSPAQRQAVEKLVNHRVLVLTGLPGTGKTTAVRVLVRAFEEVRVTFALMAPTGIAAKRLAAVTGHTASTIHRALGYDGNSWRHDEDNRYIVDAVIVDEMSMVDQELFYRLLSALRPDTMLVLVGDDAQLPSVGPGNVLRELVDSSDVPSVRLTQIFRQSDTGDIVANSHKINRGEMLTFADASSDTEFKFVRLSDEGRIADIIVGFADKLKSRDANFQVLSPKYDGQVGVTNLNDLLRDKLNPEGPREWKEGDLHFRIGDRLMVIKNDYKLNVYNGDVGKLVDIGEENLIVKIHGVGAAGADTQVSFPFKDAEEKLRLAYAITVHKSQGSEFDTIILPIVKTQGRMLQRNLLYTAVTRAKKRVWLIGEESAVERAIANNKVVRRNTALSRAIAEALASGVKEKPKPEEADPSLLRSRPSSPSTGQHEA